MVQLARRFSREYRLELKTVVKSGLLPHGEVRMDTARFFFSFFGYPILALGLLALVLVGIWMAARFWGRRYAARYVLDGTGGRVDSAIVDAFGRKVAYFCYCLVPLILVGVIYVLLLMTQAKGLGPDMALAGPGLAIMAFFGLAVACLGAGALYDGWRSLDRLRDEYRKLGSAAH
jgi:hypothetical protein